MCQDIDLLRRDVNEERFHSEANRTLTDAKFLLHSQHSASQ